MTRRNGNDKRARKTSDAPGPQTIDGTTGNPIGTPGENGKRRRIDLSTLRDVRLELAAVYRKMDAGEIESQEGTRRAYVLKTIGEIIELADLERRIEDLEDRQARSAGSTQALPYRAH